MKGNHGGRPTKYKPEYCEQLIAHMAKGFSFESFAGVVSVNRDTVHEWANAHSQFSEAKKEGLEKNRLFWEEKGIIGIVNPTIWIFNMKNRFPREWRDRTEVENSGSVTNTLVLSDTERKKLAAELINARKTDKI